MYEAVREKLVNFIQLNNGAVPVAAALFQLVAASSPEGKLSKSLKFGSEPVLGNLSLMSMPTGKSWLDTDIINQQVKLVHMQPSEPALHMFVHF